MWKWNRADIAVHIHMYMYTVHMFTKPSRKWTQRVDILGDFQNSQSAFPLVFLEP